jgi:hypothetical protein
MTPRTTSILAVLLGIALASAGMERPSQAQPVDAERVSVIKAGMVVNFLKFTEWPREAFAEPDSPVVLTMVGHDCFAGVIERAVAGHHAGGRRIHVRRMTYPLPAPGERIPAPERIQSFYAELRSSHAVFICDSEQHRLQQLLRGLEHADVLTISDIRDFAEAGGMLGIVLSGSRFTFDANVDEIKKTRVRVSSEVLRLARIVKTRR